MFPFQVLTNFESYFTNSVRCIIHRIFCNKSLLHRIYLTKEKLTEKEVAFMEITLEKQSISLEKSVREEVLEQAIDNEIMLPDFCSNIGRILKCCAKGKIISKRIVNSVLNIDGNVFLTVFYIDEEGCLKTFEQTLSFYRELSLEKDREIYAFVGCKIEHIGCRMLSARKLEVHGSLSLSVKLYEKETAECIESTPEKDIQLCHESKNITLTVGRAEKYTALTDEIELDSDSDPVTCIVRSGGRVENTECKTMAGKVIVKGELCLTVCYMTDRKNFIKEIDSVIPFTQIVDASESNEDCFARARSELTALEVRTKTGFDGEVRAFTVSAGINSEITICKNREIIFATDAYSTKNKIDVKCEKICFEKNLSEVRENFSEEYNVDFGTEINGISDIFGEATVTDIKTSGGGIAINGTVQICIIACDGDMSTVYFEKTVDFSHEVCRGEQTAGLKISPEVFIKSFGYELSGVCAKIKVNMLLCGQIKECFDLKLLSDIAVTEEDAFSKERRPALTVYYTSEEEKLFEIARKYHTTVDAVKKANGFERDTSEKGMRILLPGV